MYSRPCKKRKDGPPDIRDVEWRSGTRKGRPPASDVLALWDNETKFEVSSYWKVGPYGEIGPMQVTPKARDALDQWGTLPEGYDTDFSANLLAGARYYAGVIKNYHVPRSDADMVYSGGPGNYRHNNNSKNAAKYQDNFDKKKEQFDDMVKCMSGDVP